MELPAEARRALDITDGASMAVFGRGKGRLVLVKADTASEFVSRALSDMTELERQLRSDGEAGGDAPER